MSKFIDLFLLPQKEIEELKRLIIRVKKFNYAVVGLDHDIYGKETFEAFQKENIRVIPRTSNLERPKGIYVKYLLLETKKQALEKARKFRFDFLTVDLEKIKELDERLLNFISQRKINIEIIYKKILEKDPIKEKETFLLLKDTIERCYKKEIKVFFSSGASNEKEIRNAIDVASFLKSLGLKKYNIEMTFKVNILKEILKSEI